MKPVKAVLLFLTIFLSVLHAQEQFPYLQFVKVIPFEKVNIIFEAYDTIADYDFYVKDNNFGIIITNKKSDKARIIEISRKGDIVSKYSEEISIDTYYWLPKFRFYNDQIYLIPEVNSCFLVMKDKIKKVPSPWDEDSLRTKFPQIDFYQIYNSNRYFPFYYLGEGEITTINFDGEIEVNNFSEYNKLGVYVTNFYSPIKITLNYLSAPEEKPILSPQYFENTMNDPIVGNFENYIVFWVWKNGLVFYNKNSKNYFIYDLDAEIQQLGINYWQSAFENSLRIFADSEHIYVAIFAKNDRIYIFNVVFY